ncbi:MAG: hypothetical protein LBK52_03185, partial [Deltaproteobacteria bacterium]|nr:hypothetical protein [Deltaproteobacteria bacterium]
MGSFFFGQIQPGKFSYPGSDHEFVRCGQLNLQAGLDLESGKVPAKMNKGFAVFNLLSFLKYWIMNMNQISKFKLFQT